MHCGFFYKVKGPLFKKLQQLFTKIATTIYKIAATVYKIAATQHKYAAIVYRVAVILYKIAEKQNCIMSRVGFRISVLLLLLSSNVYPVPNLRTPSQKGPQLMHIYK